VLDVGKVLGIGPPGNPHQWYSPVSVERVTARIAAAYARVDPADANYFARRARMLLTAGLARYDALRAQIRARYAGAAVGFSESIFEPLGDDLRLSLLTRAFARAITNGTDVSAADKESLDALVRERKIRVWVYNRQNVTPDVERITQLARERHIPIVPITETLSPASTTFQQWQVAQLEALLAALKS
jgi:zinc/manganese transport system substrate-binding protein